MDELIFTKKRAHTSWLNNLKYICSVQTIIWLAVSLLIMYSLILPSAREEISLISGQTAQIEEFVFSESEYIFEVLNLYGEKGRSLYVHAELSAGIVTTLLTFIFCLVLLTFALLKNPKYLSQRKWLYMFPILGVLSSLFKTLGIVYILYVFPKQISWETIFILINGITEKICFAISIGAPLILLIWDSSLSPLRLR